MSGLAGLAAAGCGDNAGVVVPTTPGAARSAPVAAGAGPALPGAYSGLGATRAAFAGAHRSSSRGQVPGVPLVSGVVVGTAGRVTGYQVRFDDRPALSDYERLVSAAGLGDLPRDRVTVARTAGCLVYGSPTLKPLIGVSYARVTTTPGTATATVEGVATPAC